MRTKAFNILPALATLAMIVSAGCTLTTNPDEAAFLQTLKGQIVYVHRDSGVLNIYKISADGTGKTMLYHNKDTSNPNSLFPRWSADGTQIYFTAMKDGEFRTFVMDADGKNVQLSEQSNDITSTPSREADIVSEQGSLSYVENGAKTTVYSYSGYDAKMSPGASEASWSPDRNYIVFQLCGLGGSCTIMIANKEGETAELTEGMQPDW